MMGEAKQPPRHALCAGPLTEAEHTPMFTLIQERKSLYSPSGSPLATCPSEAEKSGGVADALLAAPDGGGRQAKRFAVFRDRAAGNLDAVRFEQRDDPVVG